MHAGSQPRLILTLERNRAIFNVISNAFHTRPESDFIFTEYFCDLFCSRLSVLFLHVG